MDGEIQGLLNAEFPVSQELSRYRGFGCLRGLDGQGMGGLQRLGILGIGDCGDPGPSTTILQIKIRKIMEKQQSKKDEGKVLEIVELFDATPDRVFKAQSP